MRFKSVLFLGAISAFFIFSGCERKVKKSTTSGGKMASGSVPVKVEKVSNADIKVMLYFTGDIHGEKEVKVYAKVPGKLAEKIKREGDRVKKNEVIALVDRDEPALKYSKAQVLAPISGVLTFYFAELGDSVMPPPATPVCEIAEMDRVEIFIYISERNIGKVKRGQAAFVSVESFPGKIFRGRVSRVGESADPRIRKIRARILVANPEHLLKPGTFARVSVEVASAKNVKSIPDSAIFHDSAGKFVFVPSSGRARKVYVKTGLDDGVRSQILSGLKEGEPVIVEGNWGLVDNAQIAISEQ